MANLSSPAVYASALYAAAKKESADPKQLVRQLATYLESRGRIKLMPSILRELQRLDKRESKLGAIVEVAHERESTAALKEAAARGIHATKATVNHALIKGWRAMENGRLLDQSAKRSLIEIYRQTIS